MRRFGLQWTEHVHMRHTGLQWTGLRRQRRWESVVRRTGDDRVYHLVDTSREEPACTCMCVDVCRHVYRHVHGEVRLHADVGLLSWHSRQRVLDSQEMLVHARTEVYALRICRRRARGFGQRHRSAENARAQEILN